MRGQESGDKGAGDRSRESSMRRKAQGIRSKGKDDRRRMTEDGEPKMRRGKRGAGDEKQIKRNGFLKLVIRGNL